MYEKGGGPYECRKITAKEVLRYLAWVLEVAGSYIRDCKDSSVWEIAT